ncbi:hypothetical protein [Nitrosomonas ureae]|uniref:Uncharacterized protein n=1 Tax=Nitrosomonas ureae TaxID=44577 RepID=A0A1H9AQ58_9PROT|nr:hypothetical protein [Nitrosomonas ureae]SEP78681.1 hypothetical protein SAMN05421510_100489 [Nitrosomonas ureae]
MPLVDMRDSRRTPDFHRLGLIVPDQHPLFRHIQFATINAGKNSRTC